MEAIAGYARANFLAPVLRAESFAELNAHLEGWCLARMDATLRWHTETIGQRMERYLEASLPLPAALASERRRDEAVARMNTLPVELGCSR